MEVAIMTENEKIKWVDHKCSKSPTHAHYFVHVGNGGHFQPGVWMCKHCLAGKWYPVTFVQAGSYSRMIVRDGAERAYKEAVAQRPGVARDLREIEANRKRRRTND